VTGNCDLATSTDYANFFSSYHWCWKLKNYCAALTNHSDCTHNQTRGDYRTNVINYDYLPPARLRLRLNKITM